MDNQKRNRFNDCQGKSRTTNGRRSGVVPFLQVRKSGVGKEQQFLTGAARHLLTPNVLTLVMLQISPLKAKSWINIGVHQVAFPAIVR